MKRLKHSHSEQQFYSLPNCWDFFLLIPIIQLAKTTTKLHVLNTLNTGDVSTVIAMTMMGEIGKTKKKYEVETITLLLYDGFGCFQLLSSN